MQITFQLLRVVALIACELTDDSMLKAPAHGKIDSNKGNAMNRSKSVVHFFQDVQSKVSQHSPGS